MATSVVYLVMWGHLVASQVVSSRMATGQQTGHAHNSATFEVIQSSGRVTMVKKALRFHSDPGQNSNPTEQVQIPAADSLLKENICSSLELLWQLFLMQ